MGGITKLLGAERVRILQTTGLHKIAAAIKSQELGIDIEEIDLPTAITLLATKAYEKRASLKRISKGISAYKNLGGV